jgi:hypothetical protein
MICAPLQSGEKTALAIAILVSQTLYFTLVIEVIPATSLTLPLLGRQFPPPPRHSKTRSQYVYNLVL